MSKACRPRESSIALEEKRRAAQEARDYLRFLGAWMRKPLQAGAIVPSSKSLARRMVRDIGVGDGRVVELGGGTGVFTRAILATGLPRDQLEVVEIEPALARSLRQTFPGVSIVEAPAQYFSQHAAGQPGDYQAVVSGLPLLAMDRDVQHGILEEAFRMLAPQGTMMQFTYSPRSPVKPGILEDLGLTIERAGQTLRNFPPATLFRIKRK